MTYFLLLCLFACAMLADDAKPDEVFTLAKKGDADALRSLLQANPKLVDARTPAGIRGITLAAYYGHPEIVTVFEERGAVLDFYEAATAGRIERVRALLDNQPELLDQLSPDGFPALGLAIFFRHDDVARLLIDRGANVKLQARNTQKTAPIHAAAARADLAMIRLLIEKGADVNAEQEAGFTPLHEAAATGQKALAELLLEHGADRAHRDSKGKTPSEWALDRGHADLAEALKPRP
jgi:ankyrin repeat protein